MPVHKVLNPLYTSVFKHGLPKNNKHNYFRNFAKNRRILKEHGLPKNNKHNQP